MRPNSAVSPPSSRGRRRRRTARSRCRSRRSRRSTANATIASTCCARVVGSASTAAIPPAGIASTIDGTTLAVELRALSRNSSVNSALALGSTMISVTPTALNQNGDTSRIEPRRRSASGSAASSVQYGAHASSGMSGFGGGGGSSRVAISTPPTARAITASPSAANTARRRVCIPLRGESDEAAGSGSGVGRTADGRVR